MEPRLKTVRRMLADRCPVCL